MLLLGQFFHSIPANSITVLKPFCTVSNVFAVYIITLNYS